MRINLLGPQMKGVNVAVNCQLTRNMYAVQSQNTPSGFALISSPGTTKLSDVAGSCRGLKVMAGTLYGVFGTSLYSFNSSLTSATSLGTVAGTSRVGMAHDGTNLVIVTGYGNPGYVYSGTLTQISDADFTGADSVTETAGYFCFTRNSGQWFICAMGDPTSYSALDYVTNELSPDGVLRIITSHGEVLCFGEETTQVWDLTGASTFPFELNNSAQIERGTYARWSVAKNDNTVLFLGDDLIVYRLNGYTPERVSDDGVESELTKYQLDGYITDLKNTYAYTYNDHGHKFYVLTVPNRGTHVYDIATGQWHSRKHWDYETHHSADYAFINGRHVIGGIGSFLYEMKRGVFSDDGKYLERKRVSHVMSNDNQRIRYKEIKFDIWTGQGLASGQGSDPTMIVRWANDFGQTFGKKKYLGIGIMGAYSKIVKLTNCGSARRRVIEMTVTDPVDFTILDAFAEIG